MGKLLTLNDFQAQLQELHPFSKFEILNFTKITNTATIRCLECGEIKTVTPAYKMRSWLNLCKEEHFHSFLEKANYFAGKYGFIILSWNAKDKCSYAQLQCNKCGFVFYRQHTHLVTNPNHCPNCNTAANKQANSKQKAQQQIDQNFGSDKYQILEYKSFHEKALIKHQCGFVWSVNFYSFIKSKGCPKCHSNKSKGEQRIAEWFSKNNIKFITQQSLGGDLKRYKFDFYLPDYDIAIEYQGEQHYKDKKGFWEPLEAIQKRDEIKRNFCKEQGIELLEISYKDYSNTPIILSARFND